MDVEPKEIPVLTKNDYQKKQTLTKAEPMLSKPVVYAAQSDVF